MSFLSLLFNNDIIFDTRIEKILYTKIFNIKYIYEIFLISCFIEYMFYKANRIVNIINNFLK
jgi:hypothetical protein